MSKAPVYAAKTEVSVEKSRAEIEATLTRYGADAFAYSIDGRAVRIAFRMDERQYRFGITLPSPQDRAFSHLPSGAPRAAVPARAAYDQACRQKYRALALVIKAKLEAVAAGISTVEDEFLANLVLPNRETVSEWIRPQVAESYRVGSMPNALQLEGPK